VIALLCVPASARYLLEQPVSADNRNSIVMSGHDSTELVTDGFLVVCLEDAILR
jgi:hypothetical protein